MSKLCDGLNVGSGVNDASSGKWPNELSVDGTSSDPCDVTSGSKAPMSLIEDEVFERSSEDV